jgi:hypothetical protein
MNNKCPQCRLVNFADVTHCGRCGADLASPSPNAVKNGIFGVIAWRASICVSVCIIVLAGFYLSLIGSASSLSYEQQQSVQSSISILREKGFNDEVFLLSSFAIYRGNDNWLNASVAKENAYAATNFPFEIITLYPDFFTYPADDTERAAILLHEARHLAGKDEHDAYEFVWKHRTQLGWTSDKYRNSAVWLNVRRQTRDNAPLLFVCDFMEAGDCTQ